jgi:hypothetical protein
VGQSLLSLVVFISRYMVLQPWAGLQEGAQEGIALHGAFAGVQLPVALHGAIRGAQALAGLVALKHHAKVLFCAGGFAFVATINGDIGVLFLCGWYGKRTNHNIHDELFILTFE